MKKTTLLILLCGLLFVIPRKAMCIRQYAFQQVGIRNGLSSPVRCLTVSSWKGYVWIGTDTEIGRFDGYELKKYPHGSVNHILEDRQHVIWAITSKGVYTYNYQEDRFEQVRDSDNNPVVAGSICPCPDGVVLGGRGMMYKYDYATRQTKQLFRLKCHQKYAITDLQQWDEHILFANHRWSHALLIDLRTGKTTPTPFQSNELVTSFIDSKKNIWVAPYHQGVKCYDRQGKLLHTYNSRNSPLKTNVVLSIAEHNGQIWIGTDGAGIYLLNPRSGEMTVLKHLPGDPYTLPANAILSLYNDFENNMWAGSVRDGLISIKEVGMKTYSDALPGMDYGLSQKTVLSIYQDDDNKIWIGTDEGGINCFDPALRKFRHILPTLGDKVSSIVGIDEGQLLVSLFSKGIFFFDKHTGAYRPLTIVNDSINTVLCQRGKAVNLLRKNAENIILLSDYPYCYNRVHHTFTPVTPNPNTPITGTLLPVCNDTSHTYLSDYKHIFRLNDRHHLESICSTARDTVFNSVSVDENGNFWIGSNYGLSCYSPKDKKHRWIFNKLINSVYSTICDKQGKVWIGTDGKLFAFLIGTGEFILYGEADGVTLNRYLEKPRLLSAQGDIYMGGVNGLLHISNQLPPEPAAPPVLNLADVWAAGVRINSRLTDGQALKVSEQSAPISVKLIASNKDIFRKPMFRFTLQGRSRQVSYSYLPELTLNGLATGTYKILAACSNRSGGWTADAAILTLTILPPWYKSGWFIACCLFVMLAAIVASVGALLHRKENKLKWALKEHEQQVYEEKVRFLININHELRTPLTLIHAPLKQLLESIKPSDDKYSTLQSVCKQSGRMKKLLDMVLNVRKMEVGQSTLDAEEVELNTWITQLIADFKPEAGARGIEILYHPDEGMTNLCFDKEKCTTILTNLLINALKYSPDRGRITVSVSLPEQGECVRISISDQGAGLKEVDINNLFTRFYQGNNSRPGTGIGLSYSKILAEQQGGSIGAYDHGEAPGATFWFELPRNISPGKITLQPQPYLNELLAPTREIESVPEEVANHIDTQEYSLLIVDDNPDLTDYLSTALKDKFREIRIAPDGEEALDTCRKYHPDMVVSDIQMPRMNGYELCKHVKEDLEISHTPIILLTARHDEESRLFGYKNGADAYLTKPFEVDMLYTIIRSQLMNRKRMRTRFAETGSLPPPVESTFSVADEAFLERLNKLITDNLDNAQMGIPFLCKEMGMSRASLYNKLKALTDMGANDYINKLRVELAIRLLTHSKLNINEISDAAGFSTSRYFSTVFKQHTGCTPTQYKEKHL